MIQNHKSEIIFGAILIGFTITFYFLFELLLPFVLGLILAFAFSPVISRIQKVIKSRSLATTIFLALSTAIIVLFFVFFTQYINKDFKRLNNSFKILATNNKDNLDKTTEKVKTYLGELYDFDELKNDLQFQSDSLKSSLMDMDASQLDTETIKAGFNYVMSVFKSNDKPKPEQKSGFSFILMLFSTFFYFILILYQLDYFIALREKYFGNKVKSKFNIILDDFNRSFVRYFKLRTKIILILSLIYIAAFIILDMPGIILMLTIIILLSYIPYLQYLTLIPLAVGCLVLSVENGQSFLLYFGIIAAVFILASIIEELILNPWIMEKNIGMNPVIMVLAISIWSYLLGLPGLLIGIPMTSLIIIYFKRYFLNSFEEVLKE